LLLLLPLALLARLHTGRDPTDLAASAPLSAPLSAPVDPAEAVAFSRGLDALASWAEEVAAQRRGEQWRPHEEGEQPQDEERQSQHEGVSGFSRLDRVAAFNVDRAVLLNHWQWQQQQQQHQGRESRVARFRVVSLLAPTEASNLTWDDLYPEINYERSNFTCPAAPRAPWEENEGNHDLADAVVAVVSCRPANDSLARDVRWLQLMLSLARFASQSRRPWLPLVIVSPCRPPPNLFHCRFLARAEPVAHGAEGDVWVYNVTASDMRARIQPAGSCAMAQHTVDAAALARPPSLGPPRFAFATVLHSKGDYVCGAIVLAHSLRAAGLALPPTFFPPATPDSSSVGGGNSSANGRDGGKARTGGAGGNMGGSNGPAEAELVALVSAEVGAESRAGLEAAGWRVVQIERIRNPRAKEGSYNEWNYSKLRLWQLTEYERVVFVDADIVALRPLTHLFLYPELSARGNDLFRFNSGVMLIEPALCTFDLLMANIHSIVSNNGGDQGYLNNVFTWWHRLPESINFLKHIKAAQGDSDYDWEVATKNVLFSADPPQLHAIHYLGRKPWHCFRDFDCNLLSTHMHMFANEAAHKRWWEVHDGMAVGLKPWCWLSEEKKTGIWDGMEKLRKEGAAPKWWNFTITDARKDLVVGG
ncbi:hypothetical protein CLOM_g13259, partial [Closterium sp. NIES-68]